MQIVISRLCICL